VAAPDLGRRRHAQFIETSVSPAIDIVWSYPCDFRVIKFGVSRENTQDNIQRLVYRQFRLGS